MTRTRRLPPVALVLALAGCGSGPLIAEAVVNPEPAADCRVQTVNPGAGPGDYRWLANARAQKANGRLQTELNRTFGEQPASKESPPVHVQLEHGLIGQVLNGAYREIVVVVDPALVNIPELDARLRRVAGAALAVRVQGGCFSAGELIDAGAVLSARDWHPRVRYVSYGSGLRAATSSWGVGFEDTPLGHEVGDALAARLGARVTVTYDPVERTDPRNPQK